MTNLFLLNIDTGSVGSFITDLKMPTVMGSLGNASIGTSEAYEPIIPFIQRY